MTYRVHVRVMPRAGLLDPQGQAVEHALAVPRLPGAGDGARRPGDRAAHRRRTVRSGGGRAQAMCERLLANPVTEDFTVEVEA